MWVGRNSHVGELLNEITLHIRYKKMDKKQPTQEKNIVLKIMILIKRRYWIPQIENTQWTPHVLQRYFYNKPIKIYLKRTSYDITPRDSIVKADIQFVVDICD